MEHLTALLNELKSREFKITETANGEQIQQTQRNALKAELLQAIKQDIQAVYEYVYQSAEGVLLEIANDSIADGLQGDEGSGAITVCLDLKVKTLNFDAEYAGEDYAKQQQAKAEKKKADAEKKAQKIARDKAERAKKKKKDGD